MAMNLLSPVGPAPRRAFGSTAGASVFRITLLGLVLLTLLPARAVEPFVKTVTGLDTDSLEDDVSFRQAVTDGDGTLFVAGRFRGAARFGESITLAAADASGKNDDIFLAAQNPNGGWLWAVTPYVPVAASVSAGLNERTSLRERVEIRDLKVTTAHVYLAGTVPNAPRTGFVVKLTKTGTRVWIRYILAADATVNAVAVGPNEEVYVGGGFTTYLSSSATRLLEVYTGLTSATPGGVRLVGAAAAGNYDAYVFKLNPDGSVPTPGALLAGSGEGNPEETVALECDPAGRLHVLMNLGGGTSTGVGSGSLTPVQVLHLDGTPFRSFQTTPAAGRFYGDLVPFAGVVSAAGRWTAANDLDTAADLGALDDIPTGQTSASPLNPVRGTDLKLIGGKVYVAGYGQYSFRRADGTRPTSTKGFVVRLLAEDYTPNGPVAYFKAGGSTDALATAYRLRGAEQAMYVIGQRPVTLQVFRNASNPTGWLAATPDEELTALTAGEFVARFDLDLNPEWLRTTSLPNDNLPPANFSAGMLAYDQANQRVYWGGGFAAANTQPPLVLGDAPNLARLFTTSRTRNWGWLTTLNPEGAYLLRARLTVESEYGPIAVNGFAADAPRFEDVYFQGTPVTVAVQDQTLNEGRTRRTVLGYTLDNQVGTTPGNSLALTLLDDTTIRFTWSTVHKLAITSDHAALGLPGVASLGNPQPLFGESWVNHGEIVKATIDGYVLPVDQNQFGSRYVVRSFDVSLPVPQSTTVTQVVPSLKVTEFAMTGPATIAYRWKKQHSLTIGDTTGSALKLALARQLTPAGAEVSRGTGSGTFWFDDLSRVEIAGIEEDTAAGVALRGWRVASPLEAGYFSASQFLATDPDRPDSAELDVELDRKTIDGKAYWTRTVSSFTKAASMTWDYGDKVYLQHLAVGQTLSPLAIPGKPTPPLAPWQAIRVLDAPPGSTAEDMVIWDEVSKAGVVLRPGIFLVEWDYDPGNGVVKVVSQVFTGFPGDPWQDDATKTYPGAAVGFRHIANTPPVELDPDPTDSRYFKEVKYTTGTGLAAGSRFTATTAGRSVLLFYKSLPTAKTAATGDATRETVDVRVVETRFWNDAKPWPGVTAPSMLLTQAAATIGEPLPGTLDLADLGTGYVFHEVANYNAQVYDRQNVKGPIIPVNGRLGGGSPDPASDKELVVVWYETREGIHWPYQPAFYGSFVWPNSAGVAEKGLKQIVIAGRLGSEGLDPFEQRQFSYDPERYDQVRIYNQPDRSKPGFNPNEEHARIYPSLYQSLKGKDVPAAFALRDDLNITAAMVAAKGSPLTAADYTSDPYVLVEFFDREVGEHRMAVYKVERTLSSTLRDPWLLELPGAASDTYQFRYQIEAGARIEAPYPLNLVIGLNPCRNTVPIPSSTTAIPNGSYFEDLDVSPPQRTWFVDHKDGAWAVSGNSKLNARFFYRLQPDFWYPFDKDVGDSVSAAGDCIPFLPTLNLLALSKKLGVYDPDGRTRSVPVAVRFDTLWPEDVPVLKVGETLTYAGGENKADHPDAPGLPGLIGFAAAELVFDSRNPGMGASGHFNAFMARIISPLEERRLAFPTRTLPGNLNNPASADVTVDGDTWYFNKLPPSLQKRVFFKPLAKLNAASDPGVLGLRGFVNDRTLGAPDLTAAPPPVYVLEPNVLTAAERDALKAIGNGEPNWNDRIEDLYRLSRNPNGLSGTGWNAGLEPTAAGPSAPKPLTGLGPGLALVTNPALLDPANTVTTGYVTIAENNHESLGDAPVTLHVIKVDATLRYRGALKTILPVNVFDEKITLRHTADFGGNVDGLAFAWWYHEEDGTVKVGDLPPGPNGSSPPWNPFASVAGVEGQNQIDLNGNPALLLADHWFFARYRHAKAAVAEASWSGWAGAANSSSRDLDSDGRPDYRAQLATGWVKRVLDGINPYEARLREFGRNDSPSTASSLIQQLGGPFVGPVALNASPSVVENLGLIELYETVLDRARALSVDAGSSSPGINAAILLASTRLAEFYTLLGHEAWDDALDPTLGFGNDAVDPASLNASRFCFENQLPSLLEEELALLRGVDESFGRPVYNRLFWNFTKGEGEVAYALNYQIADANHDGFIDERDALVQYPMGHGDAWGHYLNAMRKRYDLLRTHGFVWDNRSEYYNLLDVVIGVDFNDERSFARTAAARARVGADIVNLTFRSRYGEAPNSKLSGYTDPDRARAWGVTEWARRAGQAAFFDWLTANALLPLDDADPTHAGLQKVDRRTVTDIAEIATHLAGVQIALDGADSGLNALGLDPDVLAFDIDPTHIDVGSTAQVGTQAVQGLSHFEQIFERAFEALRNADAAFAFANKQKALNRQIAQSAEQLRRQAVAQDLEFRNRLIELFGTPYEGQIGPGKAYPAGYSGPDLNLFMYVDVNAIAPDTVPVANAATYFDEYVSFYALAQDLPEEFQTDIEEHFLDDISLEGNTAVELLGDDLVHLRLPATAADYTFVAPAGWGQRAAPGRLQTLVGEMLQVQSDLSLAVGDYDYLIKQLRDRVSLMQMRADLDAEILGIRDTQYETVIGLNAAINALQAAAIGYGKGAEYLELIGDATAELPQSVGTANDVTAPARQAIKIAASVAWLANTVTASATEAAANALESTKEIVDLRDQIAIDRKEMSFELRGMLHEIEELLVNEGVTRIKLFSIREQLRGLLEQYRATLQEGIRLIEERRNANAQLAAATQSNRYHDMLFRSSRHETIQRYRALYDLAQRYCYLAARAYDYETNFDPRDRASARPLLDEIVRARTLGALGDNLPLAGGGLAGVMAKLHDNFRAVEGRLGFNNFQIDTTEFSLRREMARVTTDDAWRDKLESAKVADLWAVREFRGLCRPFAPRGGPQPGIVLRFASQVVAGKNFFGQMLGAGDSAYDPTLYATKIRAAGVRLVGYPVETLARTPYVYLVPAGLDYMTIPNSPTLEKRSWNVMDQAIPVPHATGPVDLSRTGWLASVDSLSGALGEIRRFSSFRAAVLEDDPALNVTRFIGRSVWNDKWLLIVPGQSLHAIPEIGVNEFVESVTDITLTFETYGYSGN